MEFDEFLKVIRSRRAIRSFKTDPVPDEYIDKILEAARWAMSGANGQPWEFVVVKDSEIRKKILDIYSEGRYRTHIVESTRNAEFRHPGASQAPEELPRFRNAPVIIIVCGDPRTMQASVQTNILLSGDRVFHENLANTTQIIQLAASALGLGAGWVSISPPCDGKIMTVLGIPDIYRINTIVPIGYPAKPAPPYRRKLDEIVHHDKYDMKKFRSDEQVVEFIRFLREKTRPAYAV